MTMVSGQQWVRHRRGPRGGRTVYVFWRHRHAPDLWCGVQWARNKWTGDHYVASRRRS